MTAYKNKHYGLQVSLKDSLTFGVNLNGCITLQTFYVNELYSCIAKENRNSTKNIMLEGRSGNNEVKFICRNVCFLR